MKVIDCAGKAVLVAPPDGALLESERDATDLIGEALGAGVEIIAIPAERLSADFFKLSTRKAGLFIQKFTNYRLHLVIVGEINQHADASEALAAFVRESNRGQSVWFVDDLNALAAKLGG